MITYVYRIISLINKRWIIGYSSFHFVSIFLYYMRNWWIIVRTINPQSMKVKTMRAHDKRLRSIWGRSFSFAGWLDILESINLKSLKDQARVPEGPATRSRGFSSFREIICVQPSRLASPSSETSIIFINTESAHAHHLQNWPEVRTISKLLWVKLSPRATVTFPFYFKSYVCTTSEEEGSTFKRFWIAINEIFSDLYSSR